MKITGGSDLFIYNFLMDSVNGYGINISSVTHSTIDCEIASFFNCNGINLKSSTYGIFDLFGVFFFSNNNNTAISYDSINYKYASQSTIRQCKWNGLGTFSSGLDFTRSDGRDADIVIRGNIGIPDKSPHCYINLIGNTTYISLTQSIWTKISFTASSSIGCKIKIENDRITYLPSYVSDLIMVGSGSLRTSSQLASIDMMVVRNNNPIPYGIVSVTMDTNDRDFMWSANVLIEDVKKGDYFDIMARSNGSNETILFKDFNWFVRSYN